MATRNLSIRLSVKDAEIVRRALEGLGEDGQRALSRLDTASRKASRGTLALNDAMGEVRGSMDGYISRLGPLGVGLRAIGPAGVVAALSIVALGDQLRRGLQDFAEAEKGQLRFAAVLQATGGAAGLMQQDIEALADQIERTTMTTSEQVMDAASVLATFRSVSGESFTDAIRLANDLAAVFGGDVSSAATQLGKALEDPVRGLDSLRRSGVSFSEAQKEVIRNLVATGREAEAQRIILAELESQVGGAAAGAAGGVAGAFDRLSDVLGNARENLAGAVADAFHLTGAINGLATALERIVPGARSVAAEISALQRQIREDEQRLAEMPPAGSGIAGAAADRQRRSIEQRLQDNRARMAQLQALQADAAARASMEQHGRSNEQYIERSKAIAEVEAGLMREQELLRMAADERERIVAADKAEAELRKRVPDATAEEVARVRQLAMANVAAAQASKTHSTAVKQQRDVYIEARNAALDHADRMQLDIDLYGKSAAEQARMRVEWELTNAALRQYGTVSPQIRAEIQAMGADAAMMAQRNEDLVKATDKAAEAERRRAEIMDRGRSLRESLMTPDEEKAAQASDIAELYGAGAISDEDFQRALADLRRQTDGVSDAARDLGLTFSSAFEDAIVNGAAFSDVLRGIEQDLIRIAARELVTEPLLGATTDLLGGLFGGGQPAVPWRNPDTGQVVSSGGGGGFSLGGLFADLFHDGGRVGGPAPARLVPTEIFRNAPRLHSGGAIGLRSDEVPAILQRGEVVLPRGSRSAKDDRRAPVSVVMNITTPDVAGFRQSQTQIAAAMQRALSRGQRNM